MESKNSQDIPDKLYKYTDVNYVKKAIQYGVFASHIEKTNDPFERDGITYMNDYRICCMTKSSQKMVMWAYYGNHKGCVVEYDVRSVKDKDDNLIRYVQYEEVYRPHIFQDPYEIYESLYMKGQEWKHEEEYRAVFYLEKDKDKKKIWKKDENEYYLSAKVTAVYFGLCVEKNKDYYELLQYINDYNLNVEDNNNKIRVGKCILEQNAYRIRFDKQYSYERELSEYVNRQGGASCQSSL